MTAVLEFFAPARIAPDEAMLELCSQIGAMLGRVFERQRLERNLSELNRDLERRVVQRTIELTESRAALQDFLDNASDLIQSVDAQGRYRFVNRAWCETLGYAQAEAAALSMFDVIDPADTRIARRFSRNCWRPGARCEWKRVSAPRTDV